MSEDTWQKQWAPVGADLPDDDSDAAGWWEWSPFGAFEKAVVISKRGEWFVEVFDAVGSLGICKECTSEAEAKAALPILVIAWHLGIRAPSETQLDAVRALADGGRK
jgi:hypothetical protein